MATAESALENVWVVVRVRKGSTSPEEVSVHTGFTDPRPAHLLCDILNDKHPDSSEEFRVLEMPRFRVLRSPQISAS